MTVMRKIVEIDEGLCDGCGLCVPACAEGAIELVDGRARLVAEQYCDGLGACLGECPTGALRVIEREADEFDEEAVNEHLQSRAQGEGVSEGTLPCGCPSVQVQSFPSPVSCEGARASGGDAGGVSALSHWPVQIRLVPPSAAFLRGAHLLVAADCTAVAYPHFHQDLLKGKVVLVGCPKFDEVQFYIERFAEIFRTADIKGVTVVVMEVPCCQGLPVIVKKGMEMASKSIPIEQVVISTRGELAERDSQVA